jgi:hypothetical protein
VAAAAEGSWRAQVGGGACRIARNKHDSMQKQSEPLCIVVSNKSRKIHWLFGVSSRCMATQNGTAQCIFTVQAHTFSHAGIIALGVHQQRRLFSRI